MKGALPTLLVIGAQKCGTTALHQYLARHPDISMSREKELNFFSRPDVWEKGVPWYASRFDARAVARGESSPSYTDHPRRAEVVDRMHALVPEARLIYLVRDPVDRIVSCWRHYYAERIVDTPFVDSVAVEPDHPFVVRSRYWYQLRQFLRLYPAEQILVVTQSELRLDRREALRRVFRFVGVREDEMPSSMTREYHQSSLKRRRNALGQTIHTLFGERLIERLPPRGRYLTKRILYRPFSRAVPRPDVPPSLREALLEILREDLRGLADFCGAESRVAREVRGWLDTSRGGAS